MAEGCFKLLAKFLPECFGFVDKKKASQSKWKKQNRNESPIYKLVSLKGDGEWMVAIRKDKQEAIEIIKPKLIEFLYDRAPFKEIGADETSRLRKEHYETDNSNEPSGLQCTNCTLVLYGREVQRSEQVEGIQACWDLGKRGEVGETPFHICFLLNSENHRKLANLLLDICPKLSLDVYEGSEYLGESALHLAIVHNNMQFVKRLVQKGASVHERATGTFFLPEDQKNEINGKTNYIGYAYYGEYPLSFAACFGREDMYDFLLKNGAEPNARDMFGNTVLHMAVIHNQIKIFGHMVKQENEKFRADLLAKNNAGLDPLMLAAKMGHDTMFNEVLDHHCNMVWRWVDITCNVYSLESIDTITKEGNCNPNSALQYILENETDGHLAMLDNPVINKLIERKWDVYGKWHFKARLILCIVHLIALSIIVWSPALRFRSLVTRTDAVNIVVIIAEIILLISSFAHLSHYLFVQLGVWRIPCIIQQCVRKRRQNQPMTYLDVLQEFHYPHYAPFKIVFMISCALILTAAVFRILERNGAARACVALAAPGAWSYLLFFARTQKLLGPFVVMIYKMCKTDIVRFGIIFLVFLLQFSQAFYFLFKNPDDQNERFRTLWGSAMSVVHMTLGEFDFEDLDDSHMPQLTKVLFLGFALLLPLLLLNMLIAMMGNTYRRIISGSNQHWKRQWAQIVVMLEYTIPSYSLRSYLDTYAIPFSKSLNTKAIMVTTEPTQQRSVKA